MHPGPSTRALRRTLVCAIAVGAFLLPAGAAHAARGMEVALQDDGAFVSGRLDLNRGLDLAQGLNASWIRVNVIWAEAATYRVARRRRAPRTVDWQWGAYDRLVDAAAARGINVQLALTGPVPAWATGNRRIGPNRPSARHFRTFVRAAVTHFRDRVNRYSIWNEPNHEGWLTPKRRSPSLYRALYKTSYKTIKGVDPDAQVLIGETSPYKNPRALAPLVFLRKMARGRLLADGYAHHPYDFDHKPTFRWPGRDNATLGTINNLVRQLDRLHRKRALRRPDGGKLSLYLTEYGYIRGGRHRTPERRRAKYLTQAFNIALRHPRVQQMLHYLLIQPPRRYRFFDTSLTSTRGTPLRSYNALASWARRAAASGRIAVPTPPAPAASGSGDSGSSGGSSPPPSDGGGSSSGSSSGGGGGDGGGGGGGTSPPPSCPLPPLPC